MSKCDLRSEPTLGRAIFLAPACRTYMMRTLGFVELLSVVRIEARLFFTSLQSVFCTRTEMSYLVIFFFA